MCGKNASLQSARFTMKDVGKRLLGADNDKEDSH